MREQWKIDKGDWVKSSRFLHSTFCTVNTGCVGLYGVCSCANTSVVSRITLENKEKCEFALITVKQRLVTSLLFFLGRAA